VTTRLENTLADLWRKHRPDAPGVVPTKIDREPFSAEVGTEKGSNDQCFTGAVPTVPTVPTILEDNRVRAPMMSDDDHRAAWEERAAVLEFCGGFNRLEAEIRASAELGYSPGTVS